LREKEEKEERKDGLRRSSSDFPKSRGGEKKKGEKKRRSESERKVIPVTARAARSLRFEKERREEEKENIEIAFSVPRMKKKKRL